MPASASREMLQILESFEQQCVTPAGTQPAELASETRPAAATGHAGAAAQRAPVTGAAAHIEAMRGEVPASTRLRFGANEERAGLDAATQACMVCGGNMVGQAVQGMTIDGRTGYVHRQGCGDRLRATEMWGWQQGSQWVEGRGLVRTPLRIDKMLTGSLNMSACGQCARPRWSDSRHAR